MGVSIFLVALSVFFIMIRESSTLSSQKKLEDIADYVLNNVENIPTTCTDCDFLVGSKFVSDNFDKFKSKSYPLKKEYVLGDTNRLGFDDMHFCIFVQDEFGKIIKHTGNGSIVLSDSADCNDNVPWIDNVDAGCPVDFTQGFVLRKPAFYYTDNLAERKIVNVNILVCADEE